MFSDLDTDTQYDIAFKAKMPLKAILTFQPSGYWILVREFEAPERTVGGLILPDTIKDSVDISTSVGMVIDMGNGAYKGKSQFEDGPWCKIGDYVVYNSYSKGFKRKIRYEDEEYTVRLLADDHIMGTVDSLDRLVGIVV